MSVKKEKIQLFPTLCEGDIRISKVKKRAVILVGNSKGGKSTAMQWLMGRALIGERKFGSNFYVNQVDGIDVSSSFKSETLIPNTVDFTEDITFVDFPGYQDKRNYVGVFGVSFMIQIFFQRVEEVKFMIVLPKNLFESRELQQFSSPFIGFLNMFDFDGMPAQKRENIISMVIDSVTILISRANSPLEQYRENIEGLIQGLQQSKIRHAPLIKRILEHILKTNKISLFKIAKQQMPPEPAVLSKKFDVDDDGKWNFVNIFKIFNDTQKNLIKLPFKEDYKACESEIPQFLKEVDGKVNQYKEIAQVIKPFLDKLEDGDQIFTDLTNYDTEFQAFKKFVKKYDVYDMNYATMKIRVEDVGFDITINGKEKKSPVFGLDLIRKLKEFFKFTVDMEFIGDHSLLMDRIKFNFLKAIKIFAEIFAKTEEQEILCINLAFIAARGFRDLHILSEIDRQHVTSEQQIFGYLTNISKKNLYQFESKFVFDRGEHAYRKKLLKEPDALSDFLNYASSEFKPDSEDDQLRLQKATIDNMILKAACCTNSYSFMESVRYLLNANDKLQSYESIKREKERESQNPEIENPVIEGKSNSPPNKQDIALTETLADVEITQIEIFNKIGENFKKVTNRKKASDNSTKEEMSSRDTTEVRNREVECTRFALVIFTHIDFVEDVCEMYEKLITFEPINRDKYSVFMDYARYLLSSGRGQDCRKIYQRALKYATTIESRKETLKQLSALDVTIAGAIEDYYERIKQFNRITNDQDLIEDIRDAFGFIKIEMPERESLTDDIVRDESQIQKVCQ